MAYPKLTFMPKWVYVHIHDDEMTQEKKIKEKKAKRHVWG